MSELFDVCGFSLCFGGVIVVDDLSFSVCEGDILLVIGFNGVGKISVFNCIIGFYKFMGGSVRFVG